MAKRLFDFVVALMALLMLWPVFLVVAFVVRTRLGSPVLFSQRRPGLHGEAFSVYKFRTMTSACDAAGHLLPDDVRLTPFGLFLRRASLDELPQLINVLKGDISLVGPRPLLMEYLPLYSPAQARRHEVRPGITGWAQVNGRNAISWAQKFELDIWYIDNYSFWLDMKILFMTVKKVIKKDDVSASGTQTMHRFEGDKPSDVS